MDAGVACLEIPGSLFPQCDLRGLVRLMAPDRERDVLGLRRRAARNSKRQGGG